MPIIILLVIVAGILLAGISLLLGILNYVYEKVVYVAYPVLYVVNKILGLNCTELGTIGMTVLLLAVGYYGCSYNKGLKGDNSLDTDLCMEPYCITGRDIVEGLRALILVVAYGYCWNYACEYLLFNSWSWGEWKHAGYIGFFVFSWVVGMFISKCFNIIGAITPAGKRQSALKQMKIEEEKRIARERAEEEKRIRLLKKDNFEKLINLSSDEIRENYQKGFDSIYENAFSSGEDAGYREGYNQGYEDHC